MQVIRTIVWVFFAVVLVAFIAINWNPVRVNFWPLSDGYLHFDWPVGFIVLFSFVLGWIPMWLLHRASKWRANRRIASLENTVKANTATPPLATSTQLEAAALTPSPEPATQSPVI
jgi:lipopolysaccharide assembly protein A